MGSGLCASSLGSGVYILCFRVCGLGLRAYGVWGLLVSTFHSFVSVSKILAEKTPHGRYARGL